MNLNLMNGPRTIGTLTTGDNRAAVRRPNKERMIIDMTVIFQIVLTNEKDKNDYIILETFKTQEQAESMIKWYESHHRFFKGVFSIRSTNQ